MALCSGGGCAPKENVWVLLRGKWMNNRNLPAHHTRAGTELLRVGFMNQLASIQAIQGSVVSSRGTHCTLVSHLEEHLNTKVSHCGFKVSYAGPRTHQTSTLPLSRTASPQEQCTSCNMNVQQGCLLVFTKLKITLCP